MITGKDFKDKIKQRLKEKGIYYMLDEKIVEIIWGDLSLLSVRMRDVDFAEVLDWVFSDKETAVNVGKEFKAWLEAPYWDDAFVVISQELKNGSYDFDKAENIDDVIVRDEDDAIVIEVVEVEGMHMFFDKKSVRTCFD